MIREKMNECIKILKKYTYLKRPFLIILIIYLIAIFPIIRANFNYIDDIGRTVYGYKGWSDFSRYTSSLLSIFIHADTYLTDVSPLPQIIAVVILSVTSIILLHTFSSKKKITLWNIIAVLPVGLSPYFLECISYKYDSPYMALSILASVIPILFISKKKIIFSIVTIICTIIMCTTYQAASGIFPILIIFYSFYKWKDEGKKVKELLPLVFLAAISYIVGMLIFNLFIMQPLEPKNMYVSSSLVPFNQLIFAFFNHLIEYYKLVISDFKTIWLILILGTIISFAIISIIKTKQKKTATLIVTILVLLLAFILSFGIYPALQNPLYKPRAMYGIGISIALIALMLSNNDRVYILKLIPMALVWCFFVFTFTYGNALAEQKRYTDFRTQAVINDLNSLEVMNYDTVKLVQIDGSIGLSPVISNMPNSYNILNRLIPVTFCGNWSWGIEYFYSYFKIKNIYVDQSVNLKTFNLPILKDTMYHTIVGDAYNILVVLK